MTKELFDNICKDSIYKTLFEQHSKDLYNFLYYKTQDVDLAKDIVQEAFIKLWENCKKVVFSKAKGFLYSVSNNLFIDNTRHIKIVQNYQNSLTLKNNSETPQYILEENEFKQKIDDTLALMNVKQREVFLMSRIDKLTYAEIADRLDISVKAVEKRMSKALIYLNDTIFLKQK